MDADTHPWRGHVKVKAEVRVIQAKEPKDGQHPPEAGARPARGVPLGPSEPAPPCNTLILDF